MTNQKINFKALNQASGKQDLDGILDLKNESSWPDKVVAQGVQELLDVYIISYNPKEGELTAVCRNCSLGITHRYEAKQVSIFPPDGEEIFFITTRQGSYQTTYKSKRRMEVTSKDTKYWIVMKFEPEDFER